MSESVASLDELSERLGEVRRRIAESARRSHREPSEIKLVGVTKTHTAAMVQRVWDAGLRDFGENRVQEADAKVEEIEGGAPVGSHRARWHLIGHLQANKARRAVALFDVIHSLDSVALARRLDRLCVDERREELPVLIQVDLAGEETKSGASVDELPLLTAALTACERLRLIGLMTLPPYFDDAERVRPYFQRLRELRDEMQSRQDFGTEQGELSMGMSHDYEVAIEEGATMVRVGTAIFGARQKA